jgi:serine O-acetyltransferase
MAKTPPAPEPDLHAVIEALANAASSLSEMPLGRRDFPSRTALASLVEDLRALLFPGYFGASELKADTLRYHLGACLDRVAHGLSDQIKRGLMVSDASCSD